MAFIQASNGKPPDLKDIECWHCAKKGHYKTDCPELKIEEGMQNLSAGEELDNEIMEACDDGVNMTYSLPTQECRSNAIWSRRDANSSAPGF